MCTTAAKWLNNSWYLVKTRDPVSWMRWDDEIKLFDTADDVERKLLIQNPNPKEDGYYGGINEKGVALVATFVRTSENQISYIRRPYVRLILDAASAEEAVAIIQSFNPRIGGNILVADTQHCFGIEAVAREYFVEEVSRHKPAVKTNHFKHLPDKNLSFDLKPELEVWSKTHEERAEELVQKATTVDDLQDVLKDRKNADQKNAICTTSDEEACFTHSAFIFSTNEKKAWYAQGNPLTTPFLEYDFNTRRPSEKPKDAQAD